MGNDILKQFLFSIFAEYGNGADRKEALNKLWTDK